MNDLWFNTAGDTDCPCEYGVDCYKQDDCSAEAQTFENTGGECPVDWATTPPNCISQTCYTGGCDGVIPISTTSIVVEGTPCASGTTLTPPDCSQGPGSGSGGFDPAFSMSGVNSKLRPVHSLEARTSGFSSFTGRRDAEYLYKTGLWLNDNN